MSSLNSIEMFNFYIKLCRGDGDPVHFSGSHVVFTKIKKDQIDFSRADLIIDAFERQMRGLAIPLTQENQDICKLYAKIDFCRKIEQETALEFSKIKLAASEVLAQNRSFLS